MATIGDLAKEIVIGLVEDGLRDTVNGSISKFKPADLIKAIHEDTSLWGDGTQIKKLAENVDPRVFKFASSVIRSVTLKYGSFTNLVMMWLQEDQPVMHSIILNTEGGEQWLDNQVKEIMRGFGVM